MAFLFKTGDRSESQIGLITLLGSIICAERAWQFIPYMSQSSFRSCYPMSRGPRRIMANMLSMSAFKISNPVEEVVLVKTHDLTGRPGYSCWHGFHVIASAIVRSSIRTCVSRLLVRLAHQLGVGRTRLTEQAASCCSQLRTTWLYAEANLQRGRK